MAGVGMKMQHLSPVYFCGKQKRSNETNSWLSICFLHNNRTSLSVGAFSSIHDWSQETALLKASCKLKNYLWTKHVEKKQRPDKFASAESKYSRHLKTTPIMACWSWFCSLSPCTLWSPGNPEIEYGTGCRCQKHWRWLRALLKTMDFLSKSQRAAGLAIETMWWLWFQVFTPIATFVGLATPGSPKQRLKSLNHICGTDLSVFFGWFWIDDDSLKQPTVKIEVCLGAPYAYPSIWRLRPGPSICSDNWLYSCFWWLGKELKSIVSFTRKDFACSSTRPQINCHRVALFERMWLLCSKL